jgi:phosphatidylglycerophosphate synthase
MKKYIPNILTSFRIFIAIIFPFVFNKIGFGWLTLLLLLTLITDLFDGYLARKWNAISFTGKILDIAGDKILALSTTITFIIFISKSLLIVMFGELTIMSLSIYYLVSRNAFKNKTVQNFESSKYGKLKTWFLSITLVFTFLSYKFLAFRSMLIFFILVTFVFQLVTTYNYVNKYLIKKKGL